MEKYFLFLSDHDIPSSSFKELIQAAYSAPFKLTFETKKRGAIIADGDFFDSLGMLLPVFNSDLGLSMTSIVSHRDDELAAYALDYAHRMRLQSCLHLGDVYFHALLAGDATMKRLVKQQFQSVSHELMLTAKAFLDAGLNATRASSRLYIHRNTFNYRLLKFIEQTGLDIRDYHQAFYFLIAMKTSA